MDPHKLAEEIEDTLARNVIVLFEDKDVRAQPGGLPTRDQIEAMHASSAAQTSQSYAERLLPEGETVAALKTRLAALELFAKDSMQAFADLATQAGGALRGGK